jgi:hypothetical protein
MAMSLAERIAAAAPFIGEYIDHTVEGTYFDCTPVSEYLRKEWLEHWGIEYIRLSTGTPEQREVLNDSSEVFYCGPLKDLEFIFCGFVMSESHGPKNAVPAYAILQGETA